jgi:hypothetical protein
MVKNMSANDKVFIDALVEYEGYTFEEAKLAYAARQELPASAFCGPNRSYPAHDAAHVRNALSRLGTYGHKLKPAVRSRILTCLKRRAKQYEIDVAETMEGKVCLAKFDETIPEKVRKQMLLEIEETVNFYFKKKGPSDPK